MRKDKDMRLAEKYRPKDWGEVVGQEKAIARLRGMESRGRLRGNHYWITGGSGRGKTTIARIIASKIAMPQNIIELDGGEITVAVMSEWKATAPYFPMGGGSRAYIINEAHGLRKDIVRSMLVFLENCPEHVTAIFTTTEEGHSAFEDGKMDAAPLLSRCVMVPLIARGLAGAFAKRVKEIAQIEGIDGRDLAYYKRLAKDTKTNCRAMLQAIDSADVAGTGRSPCC